MQQEEQRKHGLEGQVLIFVRKGRYLCQMLLEDERIWGPKTDHWIWQHEGHRDLHKISLGCNILMRVNLGKKWKEEN